MTSRHLLIAGRVQGVGFRYALQAQARGLGLRGWVRNRHDGTVEAYLEGPHEAVEALTEWARRGPSLASVSEVRATDGAPQGAPPAQGTGFECLPSA